MEITKFKKNKDGSYTLFLENGETMTAYEEVILKYELLLTKKLDTKKKKEILSENQKWDTYYQALRLIKVKARTRKEVEEELSKKNYPHELVLEVIQHLASQKYLDDKRYADSYVNNQILTTSWGPLKIKNALLKKGVSSLEIEEALSSFTEEVEEEKIHKLVTKMVRSNHTKSTLSLKQKIKQTLLQEGYSITLIQSEIEKANFKEDSNLREKEYARLKRRLARKYEGAELERQIKMKLYQKGFTSQDV